MVRVLYLISWLGGSCQSNFQRRIRFLLHFGTRVGFSFKRKMATFETNILMFEKIEELKRVKERTELKLAILEATEV